MCTRRADTVQPAAQRAAEPGAATALLRQVLGGAAESRSLAAVMADDAVRRAYLERTGQAPPGGRQAKRRPLDSDNCPVCFEELSEAVR